MSLSRRQSWLLAGAGTLTMAVSYVDRQTLAVLAPSVTADLHISETAYGWLVSAFSFAYLAGAPLSGWLIDRVGARRGLLFAVLVWSGVAAMHSVVPSFTLLFGLRIALGLAESPSFPGAVQTVQRALSPADRARGFGVLFTGSSLGAMLAPPLAAFLASRFGWRSAFLGTALVGLAWIPMWIAVAYTPTARRVLDAPAVPTSPEQQARPTPLGLLRHPAVLRAMLVVVAAAPLIAFIINWSSKYLVREHHLLQADVGRYLWLPPLLFDVGSLAFGHAASVRGARRDYRGDPERGLLGLACAVAVVAIAMPLMPTAWGAVLVAGVGLAGGGGLFALLTADMMSRVPQNAVSSAGGMTAAAQSVAYIVAAPLIGWGVQRTGSYGAVIVVLALWCIPGSLAWIAWRPPPRVEAA